jgi:hypothetical protein
MKRAIVAGKIVGYSLVTSLCASGTSRAAQPPVAEGVVELPRFVVTDNRELPPPEAWRYATIPGFEILSSASDKATQRLLRDFDEFRQALSYVWPIPNRISQTTSLILTGKGGKFDAFLQKGKVASDAGTASLFLKQGTQTAILVDLQATTLNVLNVDDTADAATGTDSGLVTVEHDKQLYREYIRYLLSQNEPRLPAWLEEGLSQIIMRMQIDKRTIEFAKLEDPNAISAQAAQVATLNALTAADDPDSPTLPGAPAEDRDFNAALRRRALIPLDRFFAVPHDAPEAMNPLGNNVWAKQSYAFVHMCLYGMRGKHQKAFGQFLQRLAREPLSEAMFKECFKLTYKQMLMELRGYCDFADYQSKGVRAAKGQPDLIVRPAPVELREATQSEIGRIKGEALVLAGYPKSARTELIAPYIRGERDPNLLAALGMFEKKNGEEERARKFLDAAFAGKTNRPDALLEVARYRYADAMAKPGGAEGRLSAEQTRSVLEPLLIARRQPPHMPALYELAGDTWIRSAAQPQREDAQVLIDGAQIFPSRLKLIYQAATVALAAGELQPAHALADHGLRWAPDANSKKRFEDLKASLPPAPAAPVTATPPTAPVSAPKR